MHNPLINIKQFAFYFSVSRTTATKMYKKSYADLFEMERFGERPKGYTVGRYITNMGFARLYGEPFVKFQDV